MAKNKYIQAVLGGDIFRGMKGYGSGRPFEATENGVVRGYFAKGSAQIGGCENHEAVSDFVNAVATLAASRLRNWKCTSSTGQKQVHKIIMERQKTVASPGWAWMTWMTNNRKD
jgi:hypothetical protein